jgi:hypothetical protein
MGTLPPWAVGKNFKKTILILQLPPTKPLKIASPTGHDYELTEAAPHFLASMPVS